MTNLNVAGATAEVATLKEAVSKAKNSAALESTERENQEARVAAARGPGSHGKTREFGA